VIQLCSTTCAHQYASRKELIESERSLELVCSSPAKVYEPFEIPSRSACAHFTTDSVAGTWHNSYRKTH
jgi:hypothetical protein